MWSEHIFDTSRFLDLGTDATTPLTHVQHEDATGVKGPFKNDYIISVPTFDYLGDA